MFNNQRLTFPLFVFVWLAMYWSCESTYVPTVADMPMHSRAGEVKASGYLGINGIDLQGSYAATRRLSVGLTAHHWQPYLSSNVTSDIHQSLDAKVGWSSRLRADTTFGMELRLGYGIGNSDYYGYHRLSLQPGFFIADRNVEIGLAARFIGVSTWHNTFKPYRHMYYVDPMWVMRVGGEKVKFSGQVGMSWPFDEDDWVEKPVVLSVGLDVRLNARQR